MWQKPKCAYKLLGMRKFYTQHLLVIVNNLDSSVVDEGTLESSVLQAWPWQALPPPPFPLPY